MKKFFALKTIVNRALFVATLASCGAATAQITFYDNEGFRGKIFNASKAVSNLDRYNFNDRASSVIVDGGRWEVCEHANFEGECTVLRKGSYDSLQSLGFGNRISSFRPVSNRNNYTSEAPPPMETPNYKYRRRVTDRIYQADVISTRAVMSNATQSCWVDREQVNEPARGEANVGGAIIGGVLGGVLGHQVGGGRGKDLATALGVLGGGAIGANSGRDSITNRTVQRDVRRCESNQDSRLAYYDVTYRFRGVDHQVQMTNAPGSTVSVNQAGEPRL